MNRLLTLPLIALLSCAQESLVWAFIVPLPPSTATGQSYRRCCSIKRNPIVESSLCCRAPRHKFRAHNPFAAVSFTPIQYQRQPQRRSVGALRPLLSASALDPATGSHASRGDMIDVAIIGAGPAGLSLAIALREKGLRVQVFEATAEIKQSGAAVFIQSLGIAALEEIKPGLSAETVAVGRPVECIHLTRPDGSTIWKIDMTFLARKIGYPFLSITRYALQLALLRHLPKECVRVGCRLERLDDCGTGGLIALKFEGHADTVRARAVVGADGRRSMVRRRVLAPNESVNDWALTWWALANVPNPPVPAGEFRMTYAKSQAIYYGEVEDGLTMWSCTCWDDREIERDPDLRTGRALQALQGWPEEVTDMVRKTSASRLIEVFVGDSPVQWQTWSRQPGVTLIGDAAHAMLPTLAMGVTSALQDVVALAKVIDGPETPLAEALLAYEGKRRIPAALVQLISRYVGVFIKHVLCG